MRAAVMGAGRCLLLVSWFRIGETEKEVIVVLSRAHGRLGEIEAGSWHRMLSL